MRIFSSLALLLTALLFSQAGYCDYYSCAKMIYKEGWLKTYEYKGNTWGANTKKSGIVGSTAGSTTETTTASIDPGVTTGEIYSSIQFSSSWGECSMMEMLITKNFRNDYLKQNLGEVKKQVALGEGHHLDSLAFLSGCKNITRAHWTQDLQAHTAELYDTKTGDEFGQILDSLIQEDSEFSKNCHFPEAS